MKSIAITNRDFEKLTLIAKIWHMTKYQVLRTALDQEMKLIMPDID